MQLISLKAKTNLKEEENEDEKSPQEILNQELYKTIREWRWTKSQELNLPAYTILKQVSLIEIVNTLPETEKELLEINGIGKKKLQQFGAEILQMVEEYDKTNV